MVGTGNDVETWQMCSTDDVGDLAAGKWRRRWRLGSWGVEKTLETWWLGSGDDVGDFADVENWRLGTRDSVGVLAAGEWRRRWRLRGWGVETTLETSQMWSGDDVGELAAGELSLHFRLNSSAAKSRLLSLVPSR